MHAIYISVLLVVLSVLPCVARAEPPAAAPVATGAQPVEIVEDQDARAFRFMIDGQEVAVLDAEGFHVNGSIDYSGTITDGNRYSRPPAAAPQAR